MGTSKDICNCGNCDTSVKSVKKASFMNVVTALLYLLFPKCAICWAAYASFFSYLGLGQLKYEPRFQFVIISLLIIGSAFVIRKHMAKKAWFNLYIYLIALLFMALAKLTDNTSWPILSVIALLMLLSNWRFSQKIGLTYSSSR